MTHVYSKSLQKQQKVHNSYAYPMLYANNENELINSLRAVTTRHVMDAYARHVMDAVSRQLT